MAGFSRLYAVGQPGGFEGSDGVKRIECLLLVGDSDRQWWESRKFQPAVRRLGQVKTIIPPGPNHPDALLDASIAFCSNYFEKCPSFAAVEAELAGEERLDFHMGAHRIPAAWKKLREEARPVFRQMNIWQADLQPVEE